MWYEEREEKSKTNINPTFSLCCQGGTRVFKLKLTELVDDLTKKHMLGQSEAVIYVIEFQKRGLPHAHILPWLEEHSKCRTPSEIDDIISAELPSLTDYPAGYKVMTEYMLHGPCKKDARYTSCTNDGKCSKHFPKPFLAETFLNEEGYPHYRRRDNKLSFHLPNQNTITLRNSENLPALLQREEVCFAYGLLNDDREWTKAHSEASLWALGPQLHDIFITMLLFYDVARPLKLWETNWQALSEDILQKKQKLYNMRVNEYCANGETDTSKQEFNRWVLAVGDGTFPAMMKDGEDEPTWIDILEKFLIKTWDSPIQQIVIETKPNFTSREPVTYYSADEICKASTDNIDQYQLYTIEFLNSLNFPGMPPHAMCLKKELPIMLIRNVNPGQGLCNGTRLIITDLGQFVIRAKILTGSHIGDEV
nr:hypothetical protein [Tanacetum cinerariifolium]